MRPEFIDTAHGAAVALRELSGARELAVDTEGASFHRFVDRVYLLQLATRQRSIIIDPLAVPNAALAPLGALLESSDAEVVFHDADYDLRLLRRDYGWRARNVFDTRVAAQLLGIRAFGLAALVANYFDGKLDKKHQRADWSLRPLPNDMLEYAAQDTRYLLQLRDRLRDELQGKGRLAWLREECDRLENTAWPDDDAASAFMRIKGARDLERRELAVLGELVGWRDGVARELDRAVFRVVGNEQLLGIARAQPATRDALAQIRGVSRGLLDRRWNEMLEAIRRGAAVPEPDLPKFPKSPRWDRDPKFDVKVGALKAVRESVAKDLDLDPGVLCAGNRLEAVARKTPRSAAELGEVQELRKWQMEVLGEGFLRALKSVA